MNSIGSTDILSIFLIFIPIYLLDTKKLNWLIYPTLLVPIPAIIIEVLDLEALQFITSQRLILVYGLLGATMIFMLMYKYKWNYAQAFPISVLLVMAGSFYWEIPYLVRNAVLVGFELDWILHIGSIVPLIALYMLLGTDTTLYRGYKIMYFVVGLLTSTLFMSILPIAPGQGTEAVWDSLPYMLNRAVCTGILFTIFNTHTPPTRGLIFKDKEVNQ